jgi:hypothetical protein
MNHGKVQVDEVGVSPAYALIISIAIGAAYVSCMQDAKSHAIDKSP